MKLLRTMAALCAAWTRLFVTPAVADETTVGRFVMELARTKQLASADVTTAVVGRPLNSDQLRSRFEQKPPSNKKNNNRQSHLQAVANSFRASLLLSKRCRWLWRCRPRFTRIRGFLRCLTSQLLLFRLPTFGVCSHQTPSELSTTMHCSIYRRRRSDRPQLSTARGR